MNNIIKILSLSLLLAGVNILSAADDKDAANHSTSMVSTGAFCEISDIQPHIDALKREEVEKLVRYTDNLAQRATQFLDDSVSVGGPGQPTDRSYAALEKPSLVPLWPKRCIQLQMVKE